MRNKGAMLGDANIREGFVQGSIARGFEAAGSNPAGGTNAIFGMGMGMNAAGGFMSGASETNREQMRYDREKKEKAASGWKCSCGKEGNDGKFCSECGAKKPEADSWTCACGNNCTGKFCSACGAKKPEGDWTCSCGNVNSQGARFCSECGSKKV